MFAGIPLNPFNTGSSSSNNSIGDSPHPASTKHLYNVGPTSKTLGRRCTNVLRLLCTRFFINETHFPSFEAGICASNSSFNECKIVTMVNRPYRIFSNQAGKVKFLPCNEKLQRRWLFILQTTVQSRFASINEWIKTSQMGSRAYTVVLCLLVWLAARDVFTGRHASRQEIPDHSVLSSCK